MLKNADLLAKIGADTAENERIFAKKIPQNLKKIAIIRQPDSCGGRRRRRGSRGGKGGSKPVKELVWRVAGASDTSRRAAAGRAELLAKEGQYTDRLQNPAKLRRFRIGMGGG